MPVITFANQDSEFVVWLEAHANGYLLNLKSPSAPFATLHKAGCWHFIGTEDDSRTGTYNKACSESQDELVLWGKQHGFSIKECSGCKPYDH